MLKRHQYMLKSLLFWGLVLIGFLMISGIIILSAAGFKYDFQSHKLLRTGIISLNSDPQDVQVLVNNKTIAQKMPCQAKHLLADDYQIKIIKAGYHQWEKNIRVKAGIVSRQESILLFLAKPTKSKIASKVKNIAVSPDKNKIVIYDDFLKLYSIDQKTTIPLKIGHDFSKIYNLIWSPDSKKILIITNKNLKFYDFEKKQSKNIKFSGFVKAKIFWHSENFSEIFIFSQNQLYLVNLNNNQTQKILKNIYYPAVADKNLYWLKKTKTSNFELYRADFSLKNRQKFEENLPKAKYQIILRNSQTGLLNSRGDLYIIKNDHLIKIRSDVKEMAWNSEKGLFNIEKTTKLVFRTNLDSIFYYELEVSKSYLVSSLTKEISKISWYGRNDYLIYEAEAEIHIIEQDGQNDLKIAQGANFELTDDLKNLIYLDLKNNLVISKIR